MIESRRSLLINTICLFLLIAAAVVIVPLIGQEPPR